MPTGPARSLYPGHATYNDVSCGWLLSTPAVIGRWHTIFALARAGGHPQQQRLYASLVEGRHDLWAAR